MQGEYWRVRKVQRCGTKLAPLAGEVEVRTAKAGSSSGPVRSQIARLYLFMSFPLLFSSRSANLVNLAASRSAILFCFAASRSASFLALSRRHVENHLFGARQIPMNAFKNVVGPNLRPIGTNRLHYLDLFLITRSRD